MRAVLWWGKQDRDQRGGGTIMACRALAVVPQSLSFEDFVVGFLKFAQKEREIKSFPDFEDEAWDLLFWGVSHLLRHSLPPDFSVDFDTDEIREDGSYPRIIGREQVAMLLSVVAIIDPKTQRMRLKEACPWGDDFSDHFHWFAEETLDLARRISGFLEY